MMKQKNAVRAVVALLGAVVVGGALAVVNAPHPYSY
jgi:hypothetical protein